MLLATLLPAFLAARPALAVEPQEEPQATPTVDARLRALEERFAEQQQALEQARRALAEQAEALRMLREAAPQPAVRREPSPLDDLFSSVRLSGYVQADAVVYRQSSLDEVNGATGEPLNEQRFLLRRGRIRAEIQRAIVGGALEIDANTLQGLTVRPVEAAVTARFQGPDPKGPPLVSAALGLFPIPFGAEVPERELDRFFLERSSVAQALFPGNRDLGLRLSGGHRFLRYAAAVMNGEPIGETGFPGRDPSGAKDLLGRVGVETEILPWLRLTAGFSGLTGEGFHRGTPSTKDVLVWRDANEDGLVQLSEIQAIAGTAATPSEGFRRFALGGDLRLTARLPILGELDLRAEVIRAQNLDRGLLIADPVALGRDLRELGWSAGLTQELSPYAMIGLRYDRYDPDADASEQRAATLVPRDRSLSTLAAAAALRYAGARLLAEYDHRDNTLGRTNGGLPARLADDSLTFRAEVRF